jgi:hypothetical protein
MQYMIQAIGVDGFRIDAARHMPTWVFNHFDKAVFRTSLRTNHDGSIQPIYMFSEVADGNAGAVQPYIRRDLPNKDAISTGETTVKGNRDALDFPLFWSATSPAMGLKTIGTASAARPWTAMTGLGAPKCGTAMAARG